MVWVNARQNSELEISFRNRVFRLHKSVPSTKKRPRKPGTGIKVGFEEMEHEFSVCNILSGKTGLPFRMFGCSRNFSAGTHDPKSRVPFTNRIFQPLL